MNEIYEPLVQADSLRGERILKELKERAYYDMQLGTFIYHTVSRSKRPEYGFTSSHGEPK